MTLCFVYLLFAALLQLGWLYNMKRVKKEIWKQLRSHPFLSRKQLAVLEPVVLYVVLGISNVMFLTMSMDKIPPSIAYAVWTGIVIAAAAVIDQIIQKKGMKPSKIIFIMMILIGIIGLKLTTN